MDVKVLGTGCAKCKKLYEEAAQAIATAGVDAALGKVETLDEIMDYGVAMTPALVIDGKVLSSGRLPGQGQIVRWLQEAAPKS